VVPPGIQAEECETRDDGLVLLYVGISPKEDPKNGAKPSSETLCTRIDDHYKGNAEGSTLRQSLGCLLAGQLEIELRRLGSSGKRLHFGTGEQYLSGWMHDNALVSWLEDPQPWNLERQLIAVLDLPLNSHGNKRNLFHGSLTSARKEAADRAKQLPTLPNPGIGGAKAAWRDKPSL